MKSGISDTCFSSHQNWGMGLPNEGVRRVHEGGAIARFCADSLEADSATQCDSANGASSRPDGGDKARFIAQSDDQRRHTMCRSSAHAGHFSTDRDRCAQWDVRHWNARNCHLWGVFSLFPLEKRHYVAYLLPISAARIAASLSPLDKTITSSRAWSTVSRAGVRTCPSRMTATTAASRGS